MHRALAVLAVSLCLAAAPVRADCEVQGVASLGRLRMRVAGEPLRDFEVIELPIAVRPGRGTRYRDVRVLAPIAFGARTDARIPWTVPRPAVVADGMLWLTPQIEIEDVREQLRSDDLDVRVQVDVGVWVDRLHLPCDAVAVGIGEGGEDPPSWPDSGGPRWAPANGYIWLRSRPDDGAPSVRIEAPNGLRTPFIELERQGDGWVRVLARFESGAMIRGWVRHHHLRRSNDGEADPRPYVRAIHAHPPGQCRRGAPGADEYVGPARLTVGAIVRFNPDGDAWGTVSEPAIFTVSWHTGTEWVRIVHAPGLRGDGRCPEVITHAWVQRSQVSLSGEGPAAATVPGSLLGIE
ncbi:MAG: hypothetical protein KC619_04795 [Myxococcales bacterium]|nr:hypothetical protein [Myxococcales bacterium]